MFSAAIAELDARIMELGLDLPLPQEILVVRTTGDEEMGDSSSYYTRGATIVVSDSHVEPGNARHVFLHELLHVMTRHDPSIRASLYAIIGFEHCGEIRYPHALMPRKITNPDAHHFDSYADLQVDGKTIHALLLTLAKSVPYETGGIMQNLAIEFLELERQGAGMQAKLTDGRPTLYAMDAVQGLFDKIGRNTQYVIHPEEIMAENFAMAVLGRNDAPNPEILEAVIEQFSKEKDR